MTGHSADRVEEELPSTSDIARTGNIELQEIMKNVARSTEDLITQLDNPLGDLFKHPLSELLGLDKELINIRGLLKVEMVIKAQLEEHIERESASFQKSRTTQNTMMAFEKTSKIGSKG